MIVATILAFLSTSPAHADSFPAPPLSLRDMMSESDYVGRYRVEAVSHRFSEYGGAVRDVTLVPVNERGGGTLARVVVVPGATIDGVTYEGPHIEEGTEVFALLTDTVLDGTVNIKFGPHYGLYSPTTVDGVEGLMTGDGWPVTDVACDIRPLVKRPPGSDAGLRSVLNPDNSPAEQEHAELRLESTTPAEAALLARDAGLDALAACMGDVQ